MKRLLIFCAVVLLAGCMTNMKPRPGETAPTPPTAQPAAPAQGQAAAPALGGDAFTGTIVGYRMGGSMAKPYVRAKIKGEDGQVIEFNLRKTTAVTDPAGNTIGFTKRFKNGRRVEIKFTVTNGLNEAVAWHYLD
jgi:hypothetical protein